MRMPIMLFAAASMAAAVPIPVQADPPGRDPAPVVLAFCQEQVSLDPSLSLGTCMSYFLSGGPGYLTQFCHYLADNGLLGDWGFDSFTQCVVEIRQE
jgi:hypothetical protein